jgi:glycoside/pentoside/hexuronide:cation symporter, GPH family
MAEKLSLRTKLGFGICDLGGNLFFTMIGFYLLIYLTDVVGLAAGLAGTALMIGKIWDAVTDPAVGYLSDRTRSRMGRRRPYMLYGSFLLFVSMIVMFTDPGISSSAGLFVWAVLAYCLLNTAYTLVNIPYAAMLPELTRDFDQRTIVTGYRMSFAVIGTFVGAGLVLPLAGAFASERLGWSVMGGVTGGIMLATALVTVFAIREPEHTEPRESMNILKTYAQALRSKPFLLALFPWIFHITGVTVIQGALLYYFRYIYEQESMFQLALVLLLGSSIICIPLWVVISKRIGKKLSYNIGMSIFAVVVFLFFLFGHKVGVTFALITMAVGGIGFATHYVMPHAILPDVVEYDYSENGIRREGVFYGLWTFSSKLGQAFAIALNGWILSAFGYVANADQAASAKIGIRLLIGPVPAIFFIAGVIVLSYYPINHEFYQRIVEKIRLREEGTTESKS